MLKKQVILTYSNAEGMFWTHWMLLIKVHLQHPKKPSPPAAAHISPLKKILFAFIGSQKPSTPSPVARAADYVSPLKKNIGMCRRKILEN